MELFPFRYPITPPPSILVGSMGSIGSITGCEHDLASDALPQSAFHAPGEFVEYGSQALPNLPKQHLLAVLWFEHDTVLALPCRMVQVVAL
jgi:hypothetical protein